MLIVIAEKEELKLVEELGYDKMPVLITGVGGINVINALKDIPKNTEILNIGYVGSNYWKVGTKLTITAVGTNHEKAKFFEKTKTMARVRAFEIEDETICYTSTDFVTQTNTTEHCVFDMELAFIRAMFDNVRSIKVVSDNLDKKQYKENV